MITVLLHFPSVAFQVLSISFLTLTNLLIAIITTVEIRNFKVLVHHPYLVLLPVFTFFSFKRKKIGFCNGGVGDSRIQFSPLMTSIDMGLTLGFLVFIVIYDMPFVFGLTFILPDMPPIFVLSLMLSSIFTYMEKYCCEICLGVRCCNIKMDLKTFDPYQKNAVITNGLDKE